MDTTLKLFKHKIGLTKKLLLFTGTVVLIMSIVRLVEKNYIQFFADIVFLFVIFYNYRAIAKDESKLYVIARRAIASALIMTLFIMINNPNNQMAFMWLTTNIYFIFYYLERKEGWRWFTSIVLILLFILFYDPSILALDLKSFFVWIVNMLFIILIVGWYEEVKINAEAELIKHQEELTLQVEEKTKELKRLNHSLESRVSEEVEKNRQQQNELIKQSRHAQMGEMISMIAHQWRQPLAAISSSVNTLKLKNMLGEYEKEYFNERLDRIASYSQHLSGTINDFRDFFKSTKRKQEGSLEETIDSVLSIINPIIQSKHIQLNTEYNSHQSIVTYINELKQVVLNLIQNAIDIIDEKKIKKPLIILRTYKKENKLILEIEDNGGGIPEAIIGEIFDPYYSTKKLKDGTGLGLYMSKTMIEDHCEGTLNVRNKKEGALFSIELPL